MSITTLSRDRRLDSLRGFFLVVMLIDHLGGYIADFTYQAFGFASAAEGFVFLSGLMFGQVYGRYLDDPAKLRQTSLRRAALIYSYHAAMVACLSVVAVIPFFGEIWYWSLFPYADQPAMTTLAMLGLIHQPGYLDILPMYVLFVLVSPSILLALHRGAFTSVVTGSVLLWVLGQQWNPLESLYAIYEIPFHPGYFNLLGWQILWMAGLLLGYSRITQVKPGFAANRWFFWVVVLLATLLWMWRRQYLPMTNWMISVLDKPDLGPLRLLNCMLLVLIGWRVLQLFKPAAATPYMELLGRYSIQVFAFHGVMLYLLQQASGWVYDKGQIYFSLYTGLLVFCLLAPVLITRRVQGRSNRALELFR